MISVYRRYINHVARMIGGVHQTLIRQGQTGTPFMHVDRAEQLRAMDFLKRELWTSPNWLVPTSLLSKFDSKQGISPIQNIQKSVFDRLLNPKTLNRMWRTQKSLSGNPLEIHEFMEVLIQALFQQRSIPDKVEQHLQLYALEQLNSLAQDPEVDPSVKAIILEQKKGLVKWLKRQKNGRFKVHFQYALEQLTKP